MRFQTDGPRGPGGRSARTGGRSVIRYRTGCCSVDRADGPRPASGQSAWPRRTVRVALADGPLGPTGSLPSVDFAFFTVGIQTRTVREGIADSP
jgi:hypothetical protein